METTLFGIVTTTILHFTIVHIVFSTTITTYDAYNYKQYNNNGQGQHHANEPAGICQIFIGHLNGTIDTIGVHLLRRTFSHKMAIHGHNAELIDGFRIQACNFLIVFVFLLGSGVPFIFALYSAVSNKLLQLFNSRSVNYKLPVFGKEMCAGMTLLVWLPVNTELGQTIVRWQLLIFKIGNGRLN